MKNEKPFGIFHCFTGDTDQAKRAVELGFYLGIDNLQAFSRQLNVRRWSPLSLFRKSMYDENAPLHWP